MLAIFCFPALFYESLAHNARALGSDWLQAILTLQGLYQKESGAEAPQCSLTNEYVPNLFLLLHHLEEYPH